MAKFRTVLLCATVVASTACAARPAYVAPPVTSKTEAARSEQAQTGSDDERQVCELRKTLGSNHKERICRTAKQAREELEAARSQLERAQGGRGN